MNSIKKALLYGFLIWLIPFVLAFLFYTPQGDLRIDLIFFKTIMLLVGTLIGVFFLIKYFKTVKSDHIKEGLYVGLLWFAISVLLDIPTIIVMFEMPVTDYIIEIGLRYLNIIVISTGFGYILEKQ